MAGSVEPERENLRAALSWLQAHGDTQACLQLVGDLRGFWFARGSLSDGWAQIETVLAMPGAERPTRARVHALAAAGFLETWRGDPTRAIADNTEALAICQMLGMGSHSPGCCCPMGSR